VTAVLQRSVCIIGAGPSGLLLSHLLHLHGISSIVLERQTREYVESRVRAGLLEEGSVAILRNAGVADRLDRQALVHTGFRLRIDDDEFRFPFTDLSGRRAYMYGQQAVVHDLLAVHDAEAPEGVVFDVPQVDISVDKETARVRGCVNASDVEISCDFVVGCDGFHGISRRSIPAGIATQYDYAYPIAWFGILAESPPSTDELIYSVQSSGFALHSMRSPAISRLYLQVRPGTTRDSLTEDQIWAELDARLLEPGDRLVRGPIIESTVVTMRSFMCEPMSYRRLFLVGDAAHIVPPSAAKGLNLAVADAALLADAMACWYDAGSRELLDSYADVAGRRAWLGQEFSAVMTDLLHELDRDTAYERRLRRARLHRLARMDSAAKSFADSYVGANRD
jgi:p-hydroxybenzoate 3-monooxygenase